MFHCWLLAAVVVVGGNTTKPVLIAINVHILGALYVALHGTMELPVKRTEKVINCYTNGQEGQVKDKLMLNDVQSVKY